MSGHTSRAAEVIRRYRLSTPAVVDNVRSAYRTDTDGVSTPDVPANEAAETTAATTTRANFETTVIMILSWGLMADCWWLIDSGDMKHPRPHPRLRPGIELVPHSDEFVPAIPPPPG